jgi:thioredoxin 1
MAAGSITLTDDTFDGAIAGETPVLVDFWAEWCGPCKLLDPILEEIAAEQGDRLTIAKVDIDANPNLVKRFEIRGVPHLILFQAGDVLARVSGARGKHELEATVLPLL